MIPARGVKQIIYVNTIRSDGSTVQYYVCVVWSGFVGEFGHQGDMIGAVKTVGQGLLAEDEGIGREHE